MAKGNVIKLEDHRLEHETEVKLKAEMIIARLEITLRDVKDANLKEDLEDTLRWTKELRAMLHR